MHMKSAYPRQKLQDRFTQRWAIFWGRRVRPEAVPWLMGPFGNLEAIGDNFVNRLAEEEGLLVARNDRTRGLLPSINALGLSDEALELLSPGVIDFYEKTSLYQLNFSLNWNPLFRIFGKLVNYLFSNRINQLNIPAGNIERSEELTSEIITLSDPVSGQVKYTVWYRTFRSTGSVLYSGVYSTCTLPSGQACIKAVFPLPKGNATVIMSPEVGSDGSLCLSSSGKKFGDPGFYFLLHDAKGKLWSQFIPAFRDQLTVGCREGNITAEQTLTLWHMRVLRFRYEIGRTKDRQSW